MTWFRRKHSREVTPPRAKEGAVHQESPPTDKLQQLHKHSDPKTLQCTSRNSGTQSLPIPNPPKSRRPKNKLASKSTSDLRASSTSQNDQLQRPPLPRPRSSQPQYAQAAAGRRVEGLNQSAALADRVSDRMNDILTSMDYGDSNGTMVSAEQHAQYQDVPPIPARYRGKVAAGTDVANKLPSSSYFDRVWLYGNARLPPHLMPFKPYLETYPLLCLSAQHSLSVYLSDSQNASHPMRAKSTISTFQQIPASVRSRTKAMTIATATHDTATSPVVLIAIRGSSTFMDWAVNARQEPTSPGDFLADSGNLCHGGFLDVARNMSKQIASLLRGVLEDKPERGEASVILTGHSAGGAVASLLYTHILSAYVSSHETSHPFTELQVEAQKFKRVHCIIFGAPPVTLLPLEKPEVKGDKRVEKSLFFNFVNEGDPVARAGVEYVKSLLVLYTTPPPSLDATGRRPSWPVPPVTLSCPGRLVLLRPRPPSSPHQLAVDAGSAMAPQKKGLFKRSSPNLRADAQVAARKEEKIQACAVSDEHLRSVVWGDPMMHTMRLYAERVERLAVDAVTVGGGLGTAHAGVR